MTGRKPKDLIGNTFGVYTVLYEVEKSQKHRKFMVRCVKCLEERVMYIDNIKRAVKSGIHGCILCVGSSMFKHGLSCGPIYIVWGGMYNRCYNDKRPNYYCYGGRGIGICREWIDNPEKFVFWSESNGYKKGLQIDRIDNDKDYSPENCRWVTPTENYNNKSTNKIIEFDGEKYTISQAARKFGIRYGKLQYRISAGWTIEEALNV